MKLIIAGSRTFENCYCIIDGAISQLDIPIVSEVVCGGARGVDSIGRNWAETQHRQEYPVQDLIPTVEEFPADWDKFGKSAGHIRNKQMAEYADALLLIWDGESKGSANMKQQMGKLGKPIYEVILKGPK